jgi:hypothetical protein
MRRHTFGDVCALLKLKWCALLVGLFGCLFVWLVGCFFYHKSDGHVHLPLSLCTDVGNTFISQGGAFFGSTGDVSVTVDCDCCSCNCCCGGLGMVRQKAQGEES